MEKGGNRLVFVAAVLEDERGLRDPFRRCWR
jgi:hypothetical protein